MESSASSGRYPSHEFQKRVRFSTPEHLRAEADAFYADLKREEGTGIGGANVLLSCALERTAIRVDGTTFVEEVVLRRPEALGFRKVGPEQPPGAILNQLRNGTLVLEQAIGGPSQ
jgi:hypothetical protein